MGRIVGMIVVAAAMAVAGSAWGGATDLLQTPNLANAGIAKSLEQQVGKGRGDALVPGSSCYIIARDPFRSIRRGRQLFQRKFTMAQGFGPRAADGIGHDIQANAALGAGLADSCAACHGRPRGSAGVGGEVFTRPDSRDAPHLFGLGLQEMLADEMTSELRGLRNAAQTAAAASGRTVRVPLVAKGVRYGELLVHADGSVDSSSLQGIDPDLRVKPFFAHGGSHSIRQFVVGAFNDEMGLQAPDPDLAAAAAGERVVTPSGMVLDGALDVFAAPLALEPGYDPDGDGVVNEIDPALIDHMEFYLLNYFKPATHQRTPLAEAGRRAMVAIGCTNCHRPMLVVENDRRVADVETVFDPVRGHFNRLFATAVPRFREVFDDPAMPPRREPAGGRFRVENFYADLKRHDLGPGFWERNFDGSMQYEFMTEPLWGVGSTAPYGHDGRSISLHEVILRHGGEAEAAKRRYVAAPPTLQLAVRSFLESLVIFPPDDTASNLDPGDPTALDFPQQGHGSIRLSPLFVDPAEPE